MALQFHTKIMKERIKIAHELCIAVMNIASFNCFKETVLSDGPSVHEDFLDEFKL